MPEEFEGDLTEAVFWGADMSRARFRDINFTGARISHSWVVDVDIDAFVDKLVVNGVDVTDYVNERDEWYAPAVSNALPDVSFQAIRPSGVGSSVPNVEPHLPANGTVLTAGAALPWWVGLR